MNVQLKEYFWRTVMLGIHLECIVWGLWGLWALEMRVFKGKQSSIWLVGTGMGYWESDAYVWSVVVMNSRGLIRSSSVCFLGTR